LVRWLTLIAAASAGAGAGAALGGRVGLDDSDIVLDQRSPESSARWELFYYL